MSIALSWAATWGYLTAQNGPIPYRRGIWEVASIASSEQYERAVPKDMRARELALTFSGCSAQESGSYNLPGWHGSTGLGDIGAAEHVQSTRIGVLIPLLASCSTE